MELQTRFGKVKLSADEILFFPRPLYGLEEYRRFVLLNDARFTPFLWLVSVDEPYISLPLANPWRFFPDYNLYLSSEFLDEIKASTESDLEVYCVVCKEDGGLGLNLAAPVIIQSKSKLGGQVVLDDDAYDTWHMLPRKVVA